MVASLVEFGASEAFQVADDGSAALHACVLGPGPMVRHTVNASFAERFLDAQALSEKAIHYHLPPCLLVAP